MEENQKVIKEKKNYGVGHCTASGGRFRLREAGQREAQPPHLRLRPPRSGRGEPGARPGGGRQPHQRHSGRRERGPRHLLVQPRPRREPGQGEPHLRDRLAGRALPAGDGAGRAGEPRPQAPPSSAVTAGMSRSTLLEKNTEERYADSFGKTRKELWRESRPARRERQRGKRRPHRHRGPERRRQDDPAQDPDRRLHRL